MSNPFPLHTVSMINIISFLVLSEVTKEALSSKSDKSTSSLRSCTIWFKINMCLIMVGLLVQSYIGASNTHNMLSECQWFLMRCCKYVAVDVVLLHLYVQCLLISVLMLMEYFSFVMSSKSASLQLHKMLAQTINFGWITAESSSWLQVVFWASFSAALRGLSWKHRDFMLCLSHQVWFSWWIAFTSCIPFPSRSTNG